MPSPPSTTFHRASNRVAGAAVASPYTPGSGVIWLQAGHAARFVGRLPAYVTALQAPGDASAAVITHLEIIAADTGDDHLTVAGPAPGHDDASLPAGAVLAINVVAELVDELQLAVADVQDFLASGIALVPFRFVLGPDNTPAAVAADPAGRVMFPADGLVRKATINAKTAPTGDALVIDLLYSDDGVSWASFWASSGDRLRLADGTIAGSSSAFARTAVSSGGLMRLAVAQVGSAEPGRDVVVDLWVVFPSPP